MPDRFADPLVDQIATFLTGIGLTVRAGAIPEQTFLPGLHIVRGELVVDEERLLYPGDLLHEAGHLAVISAERRRALDGDIGNNPGEEMSALAWSYAAAVAIGIDPAVVFHEHGYRGGSKSLLAAFQTPCPIGSPMLKWLGLAADDFPHMRKWLVE
jgi:hypothetical protein